MVDFDALFEQGWIVKDKFDWNKPSIIIKEYA